MVCDFRALISPHIQICRSTVGIMSLRFNSDGTFRVLQMADIQDGPDVREDTIRLIEAAIRKAHPDLIVLGGTLAVAKDYIMLPLKSAINKYSLQLVNKDTTIKLSKLGEKAGAVGACMLSRSKMLGLM